MATDDKQTSGGAESLRERYADALAQRSSGWVYLAAIVLAVMLYSVVVEIDTRGWIKIAGAMIVVIVAGVVTQVFVSWRKKTILATRDDAGLAAEYETFKKSVRYDRVAIYGGAVLLVFVFVLSNDVRSFALGVLAKATSPATCVIENQTAFSYGGDSDDKVASGIAVMVNVRNDGGEGRVTVGVDLDTSEGTFNRRQEFVLSADQSRELHYMFQEPTASATDITYAVTCTP